MKTTSILNIPTRLLTNAYWRNRSIDPTGIYIEFLSQIIKSIDAEIRMLSTAAVEVGTTKTMVMMRNKSEPERKREKRASVRDRSEVLETEHKKQKSHCEKAKWTQETDKTQKKSFFRTRDQEFILDVSSRRMQKWFDLTVLTYNFIDF